MLPYTGVPVNATRLQKADLSPRMSRAVGEGTLGL